MLYWICRFTIHIIRVAVFPLINFFFRAFHSCLFVNYFMHFLQLQTSTNTVPTEWFFHRNAIFSLNFFSFSALNFISFSCKCVCLRFFFFVFRLCSHFCTVKENFSIHHILVDVRFFRDSAHCRCCYGAVCAMAFLFLYLVRLSWYFSVFRFFLLKILFGNIFFVFLSLKTIDKFFVWRFCFRSCCRCCCFSLFYWKIFVHFRPYLNIYWKNSNVLHPNSDFYFSIFICAFL